MSVLEWIGLLFFIDIGKKCVLRIKILINLKLNVF